MRLPVQADDPRALKVLAGDNEIGHLAEIDDRALSELLRQIHTTDDLLGTGYDDMMLANLVMVTRPAHEIGTVDQAAEWVGMPEHDSGHLPFQLIVSFRTDEDRLKFAELIGVSWTPGKIRPSLWWPPKPTEDLSSVQFEG
jgi:hypothetical protein